MPTIYDAPCKCETCVHSTSGADCWGFQLVRAYQMLVRAAIHNIPRDCKPLWGLMEIAFYVRHCESYGEVNNES